MGLNGVDNGQIWFDNARVSRDAMLDAYASVDAEGRYSSSIPSVAQRFGTMVGGLTTGGWVEGGWCRGCRDVVCAFVCPAGAPYCLVQYLAPSVRLRLSVCVCLHGACQPRRLIYIACLFTACLLAHIPCNPPFTPPLTSVCCHGPPAGRILIAQGAVDACKIGLTIAIRYGTDR